MNISSIPGSFVVAKIYKTRLLTMPLTTMHQKVLSLQIKEYSGATVRFIQNYNMLYLLVLLIADLQRENMVSFTLLSAVNKTYFFYFVIGFMAS